MTEAQFVTTSSHNSTFTVRRAQPDDADKLLFIWQETADLLHRSDTHYGNSAEDAAAWKTALLAWLKRSDVAVFVVESTVKEGHLLAYIVGAAVDLPGPRPVQVGYITELAVDAHAKSSGIGTALLDALKGWFRQTQVHHIEVRVPSRHAIAQAFWRATGAAKLYDQMWLKVD